MHQQAFSVNERLVHFCHSECKVKHAEVGPLTFETAIIRCILSHSHASKKTENSRQIKSIRISNQIYWKRAVICHEHCVLCTSMTFCPRQGKNKQQFRWREKGSENENITRWQLSKIKKSNFWFCRREISVAVCEVGESRSCINGRGTYLGYMHLGHANLDHA